VHFPWLSVAGAKRCRFGWKTSGLQQKHNRNAKENMVGNFLTLPSLHDADSLPKE